MSDSSAVYDKYMKYLPVMPDAAVKIMAMAEEGSDVSFTELERAIKIDPGLTTKILKVANSAMYARQREIKSLQMAITLLGMKNIRSLVMLVAASGLFSRAKKAVFYSDFWQHAVTSAFLSKHIATRTGHKELAEEVFLAQVCHPNLLSSFPAESCWFSTAFIGTTDLLYRFPHANRARVEFEGAVNIPMK